MNDRDRKMAMDACRPGSDDVQFDEFKSLAEELEADPELRRAFELIGRSDRQIANQLAEVKLPEDLHERVMDRLRLNQELTRPLPNAASHLHRRWMGIAIGVTIVGMLLGLIASFIGPWNRKGVTVADLTDAARHEWKIQGQWTPYQPDHADRRGPLSKGLRQRPTRWQTVRTAFDQSAAVYDFEQMPVQSRLYVLHVKQQIVGLPTRPSAIAGSGGQVAAAWREGQYVYVLTVAGTVQDFRELIRWPRRSLVLLWRNGPHFS